MLEGINLSNDSNIDELLRTVPRLQISKEYEQHYGMSLDLGFHFDSIYNRI